jgi:ketosteroid isomerase-like protein
MGFCETLQAHLDAIRRRDIDALLATLPAGNEPIVLILSDGNLVRSVEEYRALHAGWFVSRSWTLDFEPVATFEGRDLGVAVLRLDYRDTRADGTPLREASLLTLTFERREDRWVMIHDQNTPIRT